MPSSRPPTELLASPASDFVARFVGADRGLKRLSLSRIRDIELRPAVTGRIGEPAAEARRRALADPLPYLLLIDDQERPVGWLRDVEIVGDGVLTEVMAIPMSPLLSPETTLKDALSMMLDADVHTGIVVDRAGRVSGLVTTDILGEFLREPVRAMAEP